MRPAKPSDAYDATPDDVPSSDVLRMHARDSDAAACEAILALADDGRLLAANDRFRSLMGVPDDVLEGGTFPPLLEWLRRRDDALCRSLSELLTTPPARSSGEIVSGGRTVVWNATDLAAGRIWTFRDASGERAALRALADAESWLRLFAAHHDGVFELDADLRVVGYWATDTESCFGLAYEDLRGRRLSEALGEKGAELDRRVRSVLVTEKSATFELVLEVLGTRRVFSVSVAPLPGHDGSPPGATVLVEDKTQQAQLESQLHQVERLASVGVLAAGVAHEINNPLGYMLLNLQRVRRGLAEIQKLSDEERAAMLSELDHATELTLEGVHRVQDIVRDLKQFARSDHEEPRGQVDVHRVLGVTLEMASPELERRARVVRDFGPVPLVRATEGRLGQVFLNLLLNAAQAIPEGNPAGNEIRVVTGTDPRGRAVIEIHDTGEGIPDHVRRHIFDPFFTTKLPGNNSGLGLAICHGITASFGGSIAVESREGCGSVFRVVLPGVAEGA